MGGCSSLGVALERARAFKPSDFLNARTFGFAASRAWVYLLFLGIGSSAITWDRSSLPPVAFVGSSLFLCVALFGSAALHRRLSSVRKKPWFVVLGPTLAAVGTLLLATSGLARELDSVFLALGVAFTGIGSGLIDLCFGQLYKDVREDRFPFEIPFAFFLASALYPIIHFAPAAVGCLVCTALPLCAGASLLVAQQGSLGEKNRPEGSGLEPEHGANADPEATRRVNVFAYTWKIGTCACLVGLADGIVRSVFLATAGNGEADFFTAPLPISNLITLVVIGGCALLSRNQDLRFVYRSVTFVMALFFMLLPVFTGSAFVEGTLALSGYGTFNALIWILIAFIARRFRFSGTVAFGIGWGMVSLGTLLGQAVGTTVAQFPVLAAGTMDTARALSLIALLATCCILASYLFVFNEEDLSALTERPKTAEARRKRFQERCARVAKHYGLTPKETEILILYAKDRTRKHIQDELFISRGTVTTHLRHIYQKMDVHDKQEMLDKIENWSDE